MPSLLRYLAGLPAAQAAFQSLRHVVASGDALTSAAARATRAALPAQAVLWNVFGCSECTADALAQAITSGMYCALPIVCFLPAFGHCACTLCLCTSLNMPA